VTAQTTVTQRLRIGLAAIVIFVLVVLCALALPILLVWPWWVVGSVATAAVVLAVPVFLIRRPFGQKRPDWSAARSFAGIAIVLFAVLASLIAFPVYWLAYLVDARPTTMPLVTLTDGRKTVQFQGMQHVGSETFYKSVVYDLREALDGGYRLYYEGVQPVDGRPELTAWLDKLATGVETDLSTTYKTMGEGCGMQFQLDYFKGLTKDIAVHPDRHVQADVSYLDMKNEYDRLMREDAAFAKEMGNAGAHSADAKDNAAFLKEFLAMWQAGTPAQKNLLGLACRGFFSWSFAQRQAPSQLDKLIVNFRNARLARMIVDAKDDKIWVTYGARHVPGVIDDLKKIDPKWRVVTVKWARVIANPEDLRGELR